jgi:DNA-binding NarL/FixJ family response regulator
VVTFATLGETNKMIRYRLGVSEATVSRTLGSAMLKLNVKTPAQLVEKMRGLPMTQTHGTG